MKVEDVKTYGDCKLNIITLLKDVIPTDIIKTTILDNPIQFDIEFKSKYKDRLLSEFMITIINDRVYSSITNGEFNAIFPEGQLIIKSVISDRFKTKWVKLNDLANKEYDPLSPFDIALNEDSTDTFKTIKDKTTYTDNDNTYGFNSVESVPTDKTDGESNREYDRENPKHREYTRKGNIGNITRQNLIKEEREVLEYQILETIYNDILSVICRNSYKND